MPKYNTGELYSTGVLYGPIPQYLLDVGDIPSTAALGIPTVNPGAVSVYGVGNIYTAEAFGVLRISQIPQKLALSLDVRCLRVSPARRHIMAVPQIRRLQVTSDA